ncbi:MAG: glycosyltransferase family 2 protein, partial [Planctomycetota bacterium]
MTAQIDILLATYNSADFLAQTMDSVLQQDSTDWRLLISDGGSTDATLEIVDQYAKQQPEKIILIPSESPLSARENFSALLDKSSSDYVMFCDHDDIWLPGKISKTQAAMQQAQQQYGPQTPLLVFTDSKVADQNCNILSNSNLSYQNLNPERLNLNQLLLQNVPSGCTMMINRALVDLSRPIPPQAAMHDHWVSLVAAAFGKIIFLDEPTLLYRQHDDNYYGASNYGWGHFYRRYRQGTGAARERLRQYIDQAETFYDRYAQSLQPQYRQMLAELSQWHQLSWLGRRRLLLKHRILKTGFRRNLGLFLI